MTRKDFKAIAKCLKTLKAPTVAWHQACYEIGLVCAGSNPLFDMAKFLEACGHKG